MNDARSLGVIKLIHTIVWAFFAGSIVLIPILAELGQFKAAFSLISVVLIEVIVILVNRWSCPLTGLAAQYTDDRRANFDIYLPEWLARHNKTIFGLLYFGGVVFTFMEWAWR